MRGHTLLLYDIFGGERDRASQLFSLLFHPTANTIMQKKATILILF